MRPVLAALSPHTLQAVDPPGLDDGVLLLVPDAHGRRRATLLRALDDRGAVAGPGATLAGGARRRTTGRCGRAPRRADRRHRRPTWPQLVLTADPEALADLRAQALAPLADLRPATADKLAETLRAWLLLQGRRDEVAEALFVHPQTVRYRMGQLREAFGDRLDDPDEVLAPHPRAGAPVREPADAVNICGPRAFTVRPMSLRDGTPARGRAALAALLLLPCRPRSPAASSQARRAGRRVHRARRQPSARPSASSAPSADAEPYVYVALGDSYTAAPGVPRTDLARRLPAVRAQLPHPGRRRCRRSSTARPGRRQLLRGRDLHMERSRRRRHQSTRRSSTRSRADTDLVTIGIGGNDFRLFTRSSAAASRLPRRTRRAPRASDRRRPTGSTAATSASTDRGERIGRRWCARHPRARPRRPGPRHRLPHLLPATGTCPRPAPARLRRLPLRPRGQRAPGRRAQAAADGVEGARVRRRHRGQRGPRRLLRRPLGQRRRRPHPTRAVRLPPLRRPSSAAVGRSADLLDDPSGAARARRRDARPALTVEARPGRSTSAARSERAVDDRPRRR